MKIRRRMLGRLGLSVLVAGGSLGVLGACGDAEEDGAPNPNLTQGPFGDRVPVTDTAKLSCLSAAADVVRDEHGAVHIYARTREDAFCVQGFMMASDRMGQMELLRRVSTGRLAELFAQASPASIDSDIAMRTVGLARVAKATYEMLEPESPTRAALDAFASGITEWIRGYREGQHALPSALGGLSPEVIADWTPVDSLTIGRYQQYSLSYDPYLDIRRTELRDKLTATFDPASSDPKLAKRAGMLRDVLRFDELEPTSPMSGFPGSGGAAQAVAPESPTSGSSGAGSSAQGTKSSRAQQRAERLKAVDSASSFVRALERARDLLGPAGVTGSNNWAMAGSVTASGHALLASDPHLGLSSPMIWWPVHLVVQAKDGATPELEASGVSLPGYPGVLSGTNRHVAFGPTNSMYDATDVWQETLDGTDGVTFKGKKVPFDRISETLKIAGQPDYTWDVLIVPHHGPVAPNIENHAVVAPTAGEAVLSVRWTGHEPTRDPEALMAVLDAKTVAEAEVAFRGYEAGAQNWVLADSSGDIGLTVHAKLPYRDEKTFTWDPATYTGTLPCFVLDGASGDHEWTGEYLEEQYIPKVLKPTQGWLVTANSDPIGTLQDNDPSNAVLPNGQKFYIGADFMLAMRAGRIEERLKKVVGSATAEHMSEIQSDHQSYLGRRLSGALIAALQAAEAEKASPGTYADLSTVVASARYAKADVASIIATLEKWGSEADYDTPSGVSLDDGGLDTDPVRANASKATLLFHAWRQRVVPLVLGDEYEAAGLDPTLYRGYRSWGHEWLTRMVSTHPMEGLVATFDPDTGESALFDDLTTPETESARERFVSALLDALDSIEKLLGANRDEWRWGKLHRLRFNTQVPLWLISNPPVQQPGFPRPGDFQAVDVGDFPQWRKPSEDLKFESGGGATQRLVVELLPSGPKIRTALPGGSVMDPESLYFKNDAELWVRNQTRDVPFEIDDVAAAVPEGGQHLVLTP